jgi:diguanylate cyclase (GGDEF)-like protein/PAS domain S-box-containing protein
VPDDVRPSDVEPTQLRAEIERLNKIIRALMDRAERSTTSQGSDFSRFQSAIMLEEQVRRRTAELEAALRENDRITRSLRESEGRFRGLVSQSLVGIAMIEDDMFSYTNAKCEDIFDYDHGEMRRLGPSDLATEADRASVAETLRIRDVGETDSVEYLFRGCRKDGRIIDVEVHGSALSVSGKRLLISVVQDVTDRVRSEREIKALQDRLREQATRDALTGLHNRRYLDEALSRELSLASREGSAVSAVMGDLDHFKVVNDRYGHLAGDDVLRAFALLIRRRARASDICCRYGGEEFLLVFPGMPREIAAERAEQLRREISAAPVACSRPEVLISASFGVAGFPHDGATGDALISAADRALYAAKTGGRNRVVLSP